MRQRGFSGPRQSISRQVKAFLFLIFALLLTIGIFVLVYVRNQYVEDMDAISGWNARSMMADVDYAIKGTESVGELFIGDSFMQERLSAIKDNANPLSVSAARRDIQSRLGMMIDAVDYVSDIAVFDGSSLLHYGQGIGLDEEAFADAVSLALSLGGRPSWVPGTGGEVYYLRSIRRTATLALDDLGVLFRVPNNFDTAFASIKSFATVPVPWRLI